MDTKLQILFAENNGYLTRRQMPDKPTYNRLLKFVDKGIVERIKHGVYYYGETSRDHMMIDVEKIVPVVCFAFIRLGNILA